MTIITNAPAIEPATTSVYAPQPPVVGTCVQWRRGNPEWGTALTPRTFLDERSAFLSLLPALRSRYPGQYVAVANGDVVVHGISRRDVTRRFFAGGKGPVYIGPVGPRKAVRQASPFRSRPNDGLS